ncbi:MAG: CHAT domain-containing protein [Saprospiraceae bacterium]
MKILLTLGVFTFLHGATFWAQQNNTLAEAQNLQRAAKVAASLRQYDLANQKLQAAQEISHILEAWELYSLVSIDLGMNYYRTSKDSLGRATFENAIALVSKSTTGAKASLGLLYHKLGVFLYFLRDYDQAILNYQKAIEIRGKLSEEDRPDLAGSYYNTGVAHSAQGEYRNAIFNFKTAIRIRENLQDTIPLAESYGQLGENYGLVGDYQQALNCLSITLDLYQKVYGEKHKRVGITHYGIGNLYASMKENVAAATAYQKALEVYQHLPDEGRKANTLHSLGHIYTQLKKHDQALTVLAEALAIHTRLFGAESIYVANGLNSLGLTYMAQEKYDLALTALEQSLALRKKIYKFQKHPNIAVSYDNIGNVFYEKKAFTQAIHQYQLGLANLIPSFTDTLGVTNPNIAQLQICKDKPKLLTILMDKAMSQKAMFSVSANHEALKKALATFELSSQLLDEMRRSYVSDDSKLFWAGKIKPFFEEAIATALLLYDHAPAPRLQVLAFNFMEKSKGILLLEHHKEIAAQAFAKLPVEVLKTEKTFKTKIVALQESIYQFETTQESEATKLKDSLLRLNDRYHEFVAQLENKYPQYHRFKFRKDQVDIENLQKSLLANKTVLLEYFFGEKAVYIFAIDNQKIKVETVIRTKTLDQTIQNFQLALSDETQIQQHLTQNYEQFTVAASELYEILLAKSLAHFNDKKKLIFIPDGPLAFLPFECLLTQKVNSSDKRFLSLPYLIRSYETSYAYSAILLQSNQKLLPRKSTGNRLLAFAPNYQQHEGLLPLYGAQEEVQQIAKYYSQYLVFEKEKATKANFKKEANLFDIIHLAVHAKVDERDSDRSCLYFTPEKSQDPAAFTLFNAELFALDLKAELVVLSACETGMGKFERGEGVMSLARGFRNAGTATVVMSLWSTNDKSSQQLMVDFHRQLSRQQTVGTALHQAKIAYLENPLDPIGHPYYWASFIATGNAHSTLVQQSKLPYKTGMALLVLLSIVGLFYFLRAQFSVQ